ncbi:MAG: polymer-forming cytoskeletal protein [Burkholderiaceae bacterium]|jgi:cytoskeletal protein CcmA (bactofilin family)|nr:polymer-forming cytoskeletal protein [Betaproteobacteria bacterium]MBP6644811.1 polymer-forming cytoskeletal protein [Burkholderiaceae bacterium]
MFNSKKQPPIKSLIAQGTDIEGHIKFSEGLRVDGKVKGNLVAAEGTRSILVISETASIEGEIRADHVIINGKVIGPITASELLELQPKAQIEGDVHYKALEMHQGATIAGQLRPMIISEDEKPTLTLAASNA